MRAARAFWEPWLERFAALGVTVAFENEQESDPAPAIALLDALRGYSCGFCLDVVIGGHCLIPNTELLLKSYDSEFLRLILKSNEKRKEEIKDPTVKAEADKVAARAIALEKKLAGPKNVVLDEKTPSNAHDAQDCTVLSR